MKLHVKLYLKNAFFLALLILTSSLWGQGGTFPVQVIPQVTPPPPIYLSNYADASTLNSPLRVQIILNDLNIQNREVRLKTYFQGSGLSFQSNDFVTGSTSLFLEGGVPLVLTNVELAPYFKFENITDISPNVYGNAIPEGTYQICFEVYDLATGNRLSSKSCATTVVFQNEPPFLISPRNKTNVAETNPQNIIFQWTPRSINVTNVEYELSLVEIWDTQIDPQAAFLSSPPIFQTTTSATTYVFGPSDPLLLSGKNYAWRIQAKAKQGTEEIGLFKNQGYSEIFSFSHASACDLPLGINHEVKGSTIANIFWDDFSTDVPEYTVRYRKKSSSNSSQAGGSEWFFNKTTSNTTSLWDLKAGTTYEYQLQKKCPVTKSEWSIAKQFTTHIADNEESVYECGITPDFSLNNTDPIDALEKGDKFTAGDFPINVLEVSGSKGRFTGKGYVTIPYLNSIRVGVQFTNVLINTDKQLAEGTVITLYDPSLKNILDVDDAIETVGNVAEAVGELFEGDNDLDEIHVNWDIDPDKDIKIEDGILIITNPANGATETSPLGDDKVIVDKSGQTYHIDAGGKITKGKKIDPSGGVTNGNVTGVSNKGEIESLTAEGIQVTFESTGIYGFDQKPDIDNDKLNKEYTTIPDAEGGKYTLPHIAIEKEQTIVVTAKVELSSNSEYSLEDLKFKTKVGELIHISAINEDNNSIELEISGHYTLENETIYAVVPDKQDSTKQLTAGAFTLWHLTDRVVNVVLVSIDKAPLPDTAEIARIFKTGGSTFNFETTTASLNGTNLLGDDDRLQIADNAWLNAYNDEQNSVINQIKSQIEDFDKNKYYVLIFNNDFKTSRSIAGFMPLQRQFGFVFNGALSSGEESKGDLTAVTAHELGHGIFALQHPFTEYGTEEKATDWLMDYKDGAIDLNHMNWAQMHNPALKFYVFQDEEDGEFKVHEYLIGKNVLQGRFDKYVLTENSFSFITKAGKTLTLPGNVEDITFHDDGILYAFTVSENGSKERYVSAEYTENKNFAGFRKNFSSEEIQNSIYKDKISKNIKSPSIKVYLGLKPIEDCSIWLYKSIYPLEVSGSWNTGGNELPTKKIEDIAIKLSSDSNGEFAGHPSLNNKVNLINNYESPTSCSDCADGKKFVEKFSYLIKENNTKDISALNGIANLICSEGEDVINYDILVSQISKDATEKLNTYWWGRDKYLFSLARDKFWQREDALTLYLNALKRVNNNINQFKEIINTESSKTASKEDYYAALYYLNDDFLQTLTSSEKVKILKYIFEEDTFITSGLFGLSNDDESLIMKLINSVNENKADAKEFLEGIIKEETLLDELADGLDDNLDAANFTNFILKISKLSEIAYFENEFPAIEPEITLNWGLKNNEFILKWVTTLSDYTFNYGNNKVNVKGLCTRSSTLIDNGVGGATEDYNCSVNKTLHPFKDFVQLTIIESVNLLPKLCNSEQESQLCGEGKIVPAILLQYLKRKQETIQLENLAVNTVTVTGIILTGGELAAAKVGTAVWWWAASDLAYTFSTPVAKLFREDLEKKYGKEFSDNFYNNWDKIQFIFLAKGAHDALKPNLSSVTKTIAAKETIGDDSFFKLLENNIRKNNPDVPDEKVIEMIDDAKLALDKLKSEIPTNDLNIEIEKAKVLLLNGKPIIGTKIDDIYNSIRNKIDDILDGNGQTAQNAAENIEEIALTNKVSSGNEVTQTFKKFWQQHEYNVSKYLKRFYGNTKVGSQITVDIYVKGVKKPITCRIDNLVRLDDGTFQIIDAKSSINNNLSLVDVNDLTKTYSTKNQKAFYSALKDGKIEKITPRGQRAVDYFKGIQINQIPGNLNIQNSINFYVNDFAVESYSIYKLIF
ncbi:hypothetical protein FLV31_11640 [Cellulophaga baltica]|nr:hypothetical protein [Cellulophaga baltica]